MKCNIIEGYCAECGAPSGKREFCQAEGTLADYYKMVAGEIPPRCMKLTRRQTFLVTQGPGTKLKEVLAQLGQIGPPGCKCDQMAAKMNYWGPDSCNGEHRQEILTHLNEAYKSLATMDKLKIAKKAVQLGVWINPLDPASSVLDIAISRSRGPSQVPGGCSV